MAKAVVEVYPELWHYTTALGLHGIIQSQQLWATNIFYLNDGEEFAGFFDRKLLQLLKDAVKEGVDEACKTAEGRKFIETNGGAEVVCNEIPQKLLAPLRAATLCLDVYITSFCHTHSEFATEDGLLSQWRGYGEDGGYAIVFDTQGLTDLLESEHPRYFYSILRFGDVDYYDGRANPEAAHEEMHEWDSTIRDVIARLITERDSRNIAEKLFDPVIALSTRHKHRGFREESEVRIVAGAPNERVMGEARQAGETRPKKPVYFTPRGGILVPHISLFEHTNGEKSKLPIRRIVVGPHPEKLKRKKAVELLLDQCGVEAEVVVSDIPYLGR